MDNQMLVQSAFNRRRFLQLTGGTTLLLALNACASGLQAPPAASPGPASQAGQPQRGGVLRFAPLDTPVSLDPARYSTAADIYLAATVYEGLVATDTSDPSFPIVPRLAESWEVSEDGKVWTFHLRQGVKFHHGTLFTAQDVLYTFARIQDPALAATGYERIRAVEQVEAVDDHTVRFHLNSPVVTFLGTLGDALAALAIVPRDRTSEELAQTPSGTGPFQLNDYTPGERASFQRNEDYWEADLPYLDEVQHLYMSDSTAQIAALTSGTLDAMSLSSENIAALANNPAVQILQLAPGTQDIFVMRADQAPFQDVRVRQAFKLAVDRPGLRQVVLQGQGELGNDQPIAPGSPFWANLPIPQQDIGKAKELLAAAGYPDGISVQLVVAELWPGITTAAVALQEMVKPAGITIELERVPVDVFWVQYSMQVPFFVSFWFNPLEPDQLLSTVYQSTAVYNESGWQSPELDALIEAGRVESDPTKRKDIYAQAQQLISEQGCVIIPYYRPLLVAASSAVQNLRQELAYSGARDVWLAPA